MSVRSAQAVVVSFVTSNATTNAAVDADSLPTAVLVVSGTDNGATVTVAHVDTGRYKASVTLPSLVMGDVVEIVVSATVASAAEKFVAWRDIADLAVDAAGGVTLADGVAHGGTPGSSTATLAVAAVNVTNPSGDAIYAESMSNGYGLRLGANSANFAALILSGNTDAAAAVMTSAHGSALAISGGDSSAAIIISGTNDNNAIWIHSSGSPTGTIEIDAPPTGPAILWVGPTTTAGPVAVWDNTPANGAVGGDLWSLMTQAGHGISILAAGSGKKAIRLAGDAATDSFAIAAGAGSPADVFNADGSVNVNEAASIADAVQASPSPTTTAFAGSSALSASNTFYVGSVVAFTSGALAGIARKVTSYTGATRLITVTSAWPVVPTAADTFRILGRIDS